MKTMWEKPRSTYEGKHFVVRDAVLEPKSLQRPRPRVLVGGGEQLTLKITAREADMWNIPGASPEVFARKVEILKDYCQQLGRDVREIELTKTDRLCLAPTREKAGAKYAARGGQPAPYRGLLGSPDDIIALIRQFEEMGMQGVFVSIPNADAEGRELFAKEVMPAFA